MTAAIVHVRERGHGPARVADSGQRLLSLDAFRALVILGMIFVNDVGRHELRGVPAWMKHAPQDVSGMTFVDVVFPAFLFIVGMSIPLAADRRRGRGESPLRIATHVLVRGVGLLVIGLFMVNSHGLNAEATGIRAPVWQLLLYAGIILLWNQYPAKAVYWLPRLLGAGLLVALAATYRSGPAGEGWMHTSWWGILGLIGWAYLVSSAAYLLSGGSIAALMGVLGLLVLLYPADKAGALAPLGVIRDYVFVGGHIGGHAAITTAGMLAMLVFRSASSVAARVGRILLLGVGLALAGYMLQPLYGVNKVAATPAWCLYSAAICCGVYVVLYLVIDVAGLRVWARPLQPVGANPLLAYLLPDVFWAALAVIGVRALPDALNAEGVAVVRSIGFAAFMLAITWVLTRWRVRLAL